MLVFAAITPHPPLLIPTIGKDELKKIKKTQTALESLEEELYLAKPNIVIIISPHASGLPNAFAFNVCPEFTTDLREFGDLTTKLKFKGEMNLPALLRESCNNKNISNAMVSNPVLDHGTTVPLYYLTKHIPDITLMPISLCDADFKAHFDFGYILKELVSSTTKRVAIIASGDMSHGLSTDAPAGYCAVGAEFDKKIQEYLSTNNLTGLLSMDKKYVADAAECGFRSILILLGALKNMQYTYKQYAYEGPFGVGYLTANFII